MRTVDFEKLENELNRRRASRANSPPKLSPRARAKLADYRYLVLQAFLMGRDFRGELPALEEIIGWDDDDNNGDGSLIAKKPSPRPQSPGDALSWPPPEGS